MHTLANDPLNPSALTNLSAWKSNWTYAGGTGNTPPAANELLVDANGFYAWAAAVNAWNIAYWGGVTWPAEQWVECRVSVLGAYVTGIVARCSQTATYACQITGSTSLIDLRYNASWAVTGTVATALLATGTSVTASPAIAVGDRFRFEVHGTGAQTTVSVWRNGNPDGTGGTQVIGGTVVAGAQVAVFNSGSPGLITGVRGQIQRLNAFLAGDFLPSVVPPTPPASAKGAFSVRTTSQT